MQVTNEGSVRVDLVGGTLDLDPINLILENVVTLNVATSLKAKVEIEHLDSDEIIIESKDYNSLRKYKLSDFTKQNLFYSDFFGPMSFVCQVIDLFKINKGIKLTLSSGAPTGSGLGGSSSMGSTLYKALCEFTGSDFEVHNAVQKVRGCEARILNQGVPGYQDYYPALVGGILALKGEPGEIKLEQLYSEDLKKTLESSLTLVYSGISRNSGINNWQVYKDFFDKKADTVRALKEIANISHETLMAIKDKKFSDVVPLIAKEGEARKSLCSTIVPSEVDLLAKKLGADFSNIGIKMCGAGGGGCFLITHKATDKDAINKVLEKTQMKILDFKIEKPL